MLAVYLGGVAARAAARAALAAAQEKLGDSTTHSFDDPTTYSLEDVLLLAPPTLFNSRYAVWLEYLSQTSGGDTVFPQSAQTLVDSPHQFIGIEDSLDAGIQQMLQKVGATLHLEKRAAAKPKPTFSVFALGDALLYRDKKLLWVLYQKALRAGLSAEELCGTLFWTLKTALLVSGGYTEGLHPFVVRKTQTALRNFAPGGLTQVSYRLLTDYHRARRGGAPLEALLEKFMLEV